jgi:hypothetical protein
MKKRKLVVSDTSLSPDVTGALGGGPGSMGKFIVERPIGAINGVNVDFFLRYSPLPSFLPFLILNGLDDVSESNTFETAVPTAQYSMSGNRATFYQAPQPGDRIVAKYWQGTGVLLTVASATIHVWTQKLVSPYSAFVVGTYFAPDNTATTVIPFANAPYSLRQDTAPVFTGTAAPEDFTGARMSFALDGSVFGDGPDDLQIWDCFLNLTLSDGSAMTIRPTSYSFYSGGSGNLLSWQPSTAYAAGDAVIDSNNNKQIASTNGRSGTAYPTWSTSGTTSEGTMSWIFSGANPSNTGQFTGDPTASFDADTTPPSTFFTFLRPHFSPLGTGGSFTLTF